MNSSQYKICLCINGQEEEINCFNIASLSGIEKRQVLDNIKHAEKKAFPATEAMDFDMELAKRNVNLVYVSFTRKVSSSIILGYLLYSRTGRQANLHKICVLSAYRRHGIARWLIESLQKDLSQRGCTQIQLWVDQNREPARKLYDICGFLEAQLVEDYYGPSRSGIKMTIDLE